MSAKINNWLGFAVRVRNHIRDYVLPQYGDNTAPDLAYTADDCIKHAQRYLARFGRQSRNGEELLDLMKAAHWIQIAHDKLAEGYRLPDPHPKQIEEVENFANHPLSITEIRSDKSGNASDQKPRDALIAALREVDGGIVAPTSIVIVMGTVNDDGSVQTTYFQRTRNRYEMDGMMLSVAHERIKQDIREGG